MGEKWIVGEPGGPAGPFYSVVSSSGRVIALQIVSEEYAHLIARLGPILDCDFDTVREAGKRLSEILVRDGAKTAVDVGAEDYIVRAVIEVLFVDSDPRP